MLTAVANALEGFIFKAFNPRGRASVKEFWLIMPLIWAVLAVFLVLDFQSFWGALKIGHAPSVNPLHYGFPLLFLLSWPSRLSLTMRRLHDSGKSGRWAFVPVQATVFSVWFVLAITTAAITSGNASTLSPAAFGLGLIGQISDGFWPFMFHMAALVDPAQIGATIIDIVREIAGSVQVPDPRAIADSSSIAPAQTAPLLAVLAMLIFALIVLPLLWLAFLLLPGNPEHNRFGDPSAAPTRIVTGTGGHAAHAGLGHLAGAHQAAGPERGRAEVTAVYRQRVLQQSAAKVSRSIRRKSG